MKLVLLLADAAQSDNGGKTHILGLGWSVIDAPTTQQMAVVALAYFDGNEEAIGSHQVTLRLVDGSGEPVVVPETAEPIVLRASVELGLRTDGETQDVPAYAPFVVNISPGLPIEPGRIYRWEAEMDGQRESVSFRTRPPTPAPEVVLASGEVHRSG